MSRPTLSSSLTERITKVCRSPQVSVVYLFGSHARGTADADSDIDIAVLAAPMLSKADRRVLRMNLLAGCSEVLANDAVRIDLVMLQDVPVLLQYNVIREGRLVLATSDATRIAYELDVERRYDDESPGLEEQTNLTLHRLLSHVA